MINSYLYLAYAKRQNTDLSVVDKKANHWLANSEKDE